ncbi:hypothetical protein LEP1GSC058_2036 [Leptospira fainei serovar Hurstbridge str. BUT 6]|uniref:Uncharacterized protein n=1 Tax=Leptospira fainei serovar Hurstbridge str. BUT 6 TaxID=1193011 RepID=S3V407_9LEPT|nr:hypothetical protein [Leptospira fainei]EPG75374.1 hypothetical protein LEP1GSC058_2036 [Leptospira fainei serovar Hurstbridge str. BUT 6]
MKKEIMIILIGIGVFSLLTCQGSIRSGAKEFDSPTKKFAAVIGKTAKEYFKSPREKKSKWKVTLYGVEGIPSFEESLDDSLLDRQLKLIYMQKPELQALDKKINLLDGGSLKIAPIPQPPETLLTANLGKIYLDKAAEIATKSAKSNGLSLEFSTEDSKEGELQILIFLQNDPPVFTRAGIEPDSKEGHRRLDASIRVSMSVYDKEKGPGIESFRCQKRFLTKYPSDWFILDWYFPSGKTSFVESLLEKGIPIRENISKPSSDLFSVRRALDECWKELAKEIR